MAEWVDEVGDLDWIREPTAAGGLTIAAAIPPVYAKYATLVIPDDPELRRAHDTSVVGTLRDRTDDQLWWFGFLDTGADPLPAPGAPRVSLYAGWRYVVLKARPDEALTLRPDGSFRTLPDLVFPSDRSWLVSTLWDDDWCCVGGPADVVDALLRDAGQDAREVVLGEDATPPGHVAT